jgi:hypothetical protein
MQQIRIKEDHLTGLGAQALPSSKEADRPQNGRPV